MLFQGLVAARRFRAACAGAHVSFHIHDPLLVRILHGLWDVLEDHPEHAEGRVRWSQRVYRRAYDENVYSFDHFFQNGEPFLTRQLLKFARFMASQKMRPAWQKVTYGSEMAL